MSFSGYRGNNYHPWREHNYFYTESDYAATTFDSQDEVESYGIETGEIDIKPDPLSCVGMSDHYENDFDANAEDPLLPNSSDVQIKQEIKEEPPDDDDIQIVEEVGLEDLATQMQELVVEPPNNSATVSDAVTAFNIVVKPGSSSQFAVVMDPKKGGNGQVFFFSVKALANENNTGNELPASSTNVAHSATVALVEDETVISQPTSNSMSNNTSKNVTSTTSGDPRKDNFKKTSQSDSQIVMSHILKTTSPHLASDIGFKFPQIQHNIVHPTIPPRNIVLKPSECANPTVKIHALKSIIDDLLQSSESTPEICQIEPPKPNHSDTLKCPDPVHHTDKPDVAKSSTTCDVSGPKPKQPKKLQPFQFAHDSEAMKTYEVRRPKPKITKTSQPTSNTDAAQIGNSVTNVILNDAEPTVEMSLHASNSSNKETKESPQSFDKPCSSIASESQNSHTLSSKNLKVGTHPLGVTDTNRSNEETTGTLKLPTSGSIVKPVSKGTAEQADSTTTDVGLPNNTSISISLDSLTDESVSSTEVPSVVADSSSVRTDNHSRVRRFPWPENLHADETPIRKKLKLMTDAQRVFGEMKKLQLKLAVMDLERTRMDLEVTRMQAQYEKEIAELRYHSSQELLRLDDSLDLIPESFDLWD